MSTPNPDNTQPANDNAPGSQNRRNLSEISHLFLSDLRSGPGRTPPRRTPPGEEPAPQETTPPPAPQAFAEEQVSSRDEDEDYRGDESIDLTPDEFADLVARQFGGSSVRDGEEQPAREEDAEEAATGAPRVYAVIGARLNGTFVRRSCQYAASLCEDADETVGVVVVEADRLRVLGVSATGPDVEAESPEEITDVEALRAAFNELNCDIRQWLVVLPDPHLPAARRLLGRLEQWVLLATADHDGVVASYRTLKGLCDLPIGDDECDAVSHDGPRIMLALLDAPSASDAHRHARKLVGVCKQFLDLDLAAGQTAPSTGKVSHNASVSSQEILVCPLGSPQKARAAWSVVEQVLTPATTSPAPSTQTSPKAPAAMFEHRPTSSNPQAAPAVDSRFIPPIARPAPRSDKPAAPSGADAWVAPAEAPEPVRRQLLDEIRIPDIARPVGATQATAPDAPASPATDEVIDLPAGSGVADVVLERLEVVTTPIVVPMLPAGKLCVDREGGLMLVAAASPGLSDLGAIGRAMTWVAESRQLLTMALAQYRINTADVRLHLLVSHGDADADALRPLLGTGRVSVQRYRRLTWGGRCGVLLEAA